MRKPQQKVLSKLPGSDDKSIGRRTPLNNRSAHRSPGRRRRETAFCKTEESSKAASRPGGNERSFPSLALCVRVKLSWLAQSIFVRRASSSMQLVSIEQGCTRLWLGRRTEHHRDMPEPTPRASQPFRNSRQRKIPATGADQVSRSRDFR